MIFDSITKSNRQGGNCKRLAEVKYKKEIKKLKMRRKSLNVNYHGDKINGLQMMMMMIMMMTLNQKKRRLRNRVKFKVRAIKYYTI